MPTHNKTMSEKTAIVLVVLMALLQGFYALYAFIDPAAFAGVRGTELISPADSDWVQIYASRTLFIALIIAYLLSIKNYRILMYTTLFGMAMPITDAVLAFNAGAPDQVVIKHMVTVIYLAVTFVILRNVVKDHALQE